MDLYFSKRDNNLTVPIILGIFIIYIFFPIVSSGLPKIFRYMLFFLFFLLPLLGDEIYLGGIKTETIGLFLVEMILTLLLYIGKWKGRGVEFYSFFLEQYMFWFPLQVIHFIHHIPLQMRKKLVSLTWLCLIITGVTTIWGNIRYVEISRFLATGRAGKSLFFRQNIGGYEFVYSSVILLPFLIYEIKNEKAKRVLYLLCLLMILGIAVITQYATAIILIVLAFAFLIILQTLSPKRLVFVFLIFAIFYYIGTIMLPKWLIAAQDYFHEVGSVQLEERFGLIYDAFFKQETSGDLLSRQQLYQKSAQAFFENPAFGNLFGGEEIGGHSEFLDVLGATGIVGMFFYIVLFISFFTKVRMLKGNNIYVHIVVSILLFSFLSCINTVLFKEIGYVVFLFPFLLKNDENGMNTLCTHQTKYKYIR